MRSKGSRLFRKQSAPPASSSLTLLKIRRVDELVAGLHRDRGRSAGDVVRVGAVRPDVVRGDALAVDRRVDDDRLRDAGRTAERDGAPPLDRDQCEPPKMVEEYATIAQPGGPACRSEPRRGRLRAPRPPPDRPAARPRSRCGGRQPGAGGTILPAGLAYGAARSAGRATGTGSPAGKSAAWHPGDADLAAEVEERLRAVRVEGVAGPLLHPGDVRVDR